VIKRNMGFFVGGYLVHQCLGGWTTRLV
jgi:hypothetical protein